MATLFNTKISETYEGLLKTIDNAAISATLKELTDGSGNQSGLYLNTAGDFKVSNILEWGSLKDTGTGVTITRYVTSTDGLENFDNNTSLPTSAAVKLYVDTKFATSDTLQEVLVFGNTTGGNDIVVSPNDNVLFSVGGVGIGSSSKAIFGSGSGEQLSISNNGNDGFIYNSNTLNITGERVFFKYIDGSAFLIAENDAVQIRHNNQTVIQTVNTGISVTGIISNLTNPIAAQDAATKSYVDGLDAGSNLDITDGTTTGVVNLNTQALSILGTTNEIDAVVSGQGVTIGLPSSISTDLVGDVTGNVTGNVTGDLTGTASLINVSAASVDQNEKVLLSTGVGSQSVLNDAGLLFNPVTHLLTVDGSGTFAGDLTVTGNITGGGGSFLPLAGGIMTGDTIHNDNVKSIYGTASDGLEIYHDSLNSVIRDSGTGNLVIAADDFRLQISEQTANMITANTGAEVNLMYNGGTKLATTNTGIYVTGNVVPTGNVFIQDAGQLILGASLNGRIYHDGSNFYANNSTGQLNIDQAAVTESIVFKTSDANALDTTALTISRNGDMVTGRDVTIAGDLTVNGTTTTVNSQTLSVDDPLISLAINNAANSLDIGYYGKYNDGTTRYLGLFNDASDSNKFKLFKGTTVEPTTTVDIGAAGYAAADLQVAGFEATTGTFTGNVTSNSTTAFSVGTIGSIGNTANDINIYSTTTGHNGLRMHANGILPTDNSGTIIDNDADLGEASYRFKNLYLGSEIISGGGATFAGKIIAGAGASAQATINAYSTTVSANLYSALRVIDNTGASSYWDIGATGGASTLLNFYHNANTTPKISFTHTGGATFTDNVGIGTDSPSAKLEVLKSGTNEFPTLGTASGNLFLTDSGLWGMFIGVDSSSGAGWIQQMRNDSATAYNISLNPVGGNVGIGTDNPNAKLHILENDDTVYDPSADDGQRGVGATIQLNNNSTVTNTFGQIMHDTDSSGQAIARMVFLDAGASSSAIAFVTENGEQKGERLRIAPNGNVGIGTDSPTNILHTSTSSNTVGRFESTDSDSHIRINDTDDSFYIGTVSQKGYLGGSAGVSSNNMNIDLTNGSVGIGTASPDTLLQTTNTADGTDYISYEIGNTAVNASNKGGFAIYELGVKKATLEYYRDGSGKFEIASQGAGNSISLSTTAAGDTTPTERMRISSTGNVGIGTGNVSESFQVYEIGNTAYKSYTNANAGAILTGYQSDSGSPYLKTTDLAAGSDGTVPSEIRFLTRTSGTATIDPRMIISSTGNVGIGTNSPDADFVVSHQGTSGIEIEANFQMGVNNILSFDRTAGALAYETMRLSANDFWFTVLGVERMRIDSAGNVGIGTNSPSNLLSVGVANNTTSKGIAIENTSGDVYGRFGVINPSINNDTYIGSVSNNNFLLYTNNTEAMRITSGGDVLISKQSLGLGVVGTEFRANGQSLFTADGDNAIDLNRLTNDGQIAIFRRAATVVGSISVTGSATAYNTSSDYRLKEDLQDFAGLDMVSKIPVYDFKWKSDESRSYGVMAHELQEVLPDAVSGDKDAEEMQGVDYSKIVPLLIKSIQELKQEIEILKAK